MRKVSNCGESQSWRLLYSLRTTHVQLAKKSFLAGIDTSRRALVARRIFMRKCGFAFRAAKSCGAGFSPSPQKVSLGSPARLQAPSRRLAVANNFLRFCAYGAEKELLHSIAPHFSGCDTFLPSRWHLAGHMRDTFRKTKQIRPECFLSISRWQ